MKGFKKTGLMFLALVIALAGIGVGYASWTDTITIEGTVNTGSVDIDMMKFSGTWVYKVPDHGTVWQHGWGTAGDRPQAPTDGVLIAYAETVGIGLDDDGDSDGRTDDADTAIVVFDSLFPGLFMVDFLVHYNGTIPAILSAEISGDAWLEALWNAGGAGVVVYASNEAGTFDHASPIVEPIVQVHYCEWYLVKLWIDIPQEDTMMRLSGSFTATVTATQWNLAAN